MNDYPIVANAETIRLIMFSAFNLVGAWWLGTTRLRDAGMKPTISFARHTPTRRVVVAVSEFRVWVEARLNIIARIEPRPANSRNQVFSSDAQSRYLISIC